MEGICPSYPEGPGAPPSPSNASSKSHTRTSCYLHGCEFVATTSMKPVPWASAALYSRPDARSKIFRREWLVARESWARKQVKNRSQPPRSRSPSPQQARNPPIRALARISLADCRSGKRVDRRRWCDDEIATTWIDSSRAAWPHRFHQFAANPRPSPGLSAVGRSLGSPIDPRDRRRRTMKRALQPSQRSIGMRAT